jgi:tRNA A37 threonylcarbamoyladenosine modification protein TsaB
VIDARRHEIFTVVDGERTVLVPDELALEPDVMCVGSGAVRYRTLLEERGAVVPPDDDERHVPRARFHAQLARDFGPVDSIEPLYLRVPDAERSAR